MDPQSTRGIRYAVFDHDGTISVLRQGWEEVMERMMVRAILGEKYDIAGENLYNQVLRRVRDYIDRSTGLQTILQMEHLAGMVKEFGVVPAEKVKDSMQYKAIYNRALLDTVNRRIEGLRCGRYDRSDFTVKGAVDFLHALRSRGISLYLASGTDRDDVVREAEVLGYAGLFEGGIYGALGDVRRYSKRKVLQNIMKGNDLEGPELLVVGDGPVEMRECRRVNGIALGVASCEVRRYGLNTEKRTRLIKAGAQVLVPDFSWGKEILAFLFG